MTTTTVIDKDSTIQRGMSDDEIVAALDRGRAAARKPLSPKVRFLVRAVYFAGTVGTAYGLWDLLVHLGGFNPWFALGIVLLYEAFAVGAFTFSTRARLRGQSGLWLRSVAYLGSLGTAVTQVIFHWADNRLLAVVLPLASVLSLVFYTLDVYDANADVFMALAELDRRKREADRAARAERRAYRKALGGQVADQKERGYIVTIGDRRREVEANKVMAALDAEDPMLAIEGELVEPTSGASDRQVTGRPVSGAPVVGDDKYAEAMRKLPSWSVRVEYMAQQHPDMGPAELMRKMAPYGCDLARPTFSESRSRGLGLGKKPPSQALALLSEPLDVEAVAADAA